MAGYRKLGRTASQRKALLRNQVTNLLYNGKIVTTEAKAKEIRRIAESIIALGVREKDNFETVTVKSTVAKRDENGVKVTEEKTTKEEPTEENTTPEETTPQETTPEETTPQEDTQDTSSEAPDDTEEGTTTKSDEDEGL